MSLSGALSPPGLRYFRPEGSSKEKHKLMTEVTRNARSRNTSQDSKDCLS